MALKSYLDFKSVIGTNILHIRGSIWPEDRLLVLYILFVEISTGKQKILQEKGCVFVLLHVS